MTTRSRMLTIVGVLGFVALLLWSTLAGQKVECTVAVEFNGSQGSAAASAASETDATREAQTAACGPLTGSMDDRISCAARPPTSRRCRPL